MYEIAVVAAAVLFVAAALGLAKWQETPVRRDARTCEERTRALDALDRCTR